MAFKLINTLSQVKNKVLKSVKHYEKIKIVKVFKKKNKGENLFGLEKRKNYYRSLLKCECGHYYNLHKYSKFLEKVYKKSYSDYSNKNIENKF